MIAILPPLIDSLRNELQQYGEMLALLEAQQEDVCRRDPEAVLTSVAAVEAQGAAIQAARRSREQLQRQLAWSAGHPEGHAFDELLPLLPGDYRPLVSALIQEINELLERVRERAALNLQQLRQALSLIERFLTTLFPEAPSARLAGDSDSSRINPPPSAAASV